MIKVNVFILNKRPGDVVSPGDKFYDTFKSWAERGDRNGGAVICNFHEEAPVDEVPLGEADIDTPLDEVPASDEDPAGDESPVEAPKKNKKGK